MFMKVLITGHPGSGKSSICLRIFEQVKSKRKIGGFVSSEIREGGIRKGFKILDLDTGKEGILAHINLNKGPAIGKYRVNLKDLNGIGVSAIKNALEKCDLVIIDEIGPMELKSLEFVSAVRDAFRGDAKVIATVHYRLRHPVIEEIKGMARLYRIDVSNRDVVFEEILSKFTTIKFKKEKKEVLPPS